jgi:hypothetical protein
MESEMNQLKTVFSRPWSIRLPILTRYLEAKYVDAFFEDGSLRLSSFRKFRKSPDEERGDIFEGRVNMEITIPNAHHAICAISGQEAYVMSTTTVESRKLGASLKSDSGFRILNSLAFADCVSRQIAGFLGGCQGLCIYRDDIVIQKKDSEPMRTPESYSNPEERAADYDKYVSKHIVDAFFLKRAEYSHQGEYRFIWFAQGTEKDHLDVKCPDAIKYCERLTTDQLEQRT